MGRVKYRSKFEESTAKFLRASKVRFDYESKEHLVTYTTEATYLPDFILPNGIYCECKGWFRSSDMAKMKRVVEQHPELDIRMVFQEPNNKIRKGSKTTYGRWCDKHGIKWGTVSDIPKWAKEKPKG